MIVIEDLSVGYGGKEIVKNVNLKIEKGFIGILGPNGSGKTTFLRAIAGILKPIRGSVKINGLDIHNLPRKAASKLVTMVSQDFQPVYDYTAIEIVKMAFTTRSIFPSPEDDERSLRALEVVGISHLSNRYFSTLSGGEKRLVMLARALAQDSKVILVDELELHLDPLHKKKMADTLKKISEMGKIVISVFHDVQLATSYSERFIGISNGTIAFDKSDLQAEDLTTLFGSNFKEIQDVIVPWYL
jgi:iron complex transport system ATP-binding protein